MFLESPDHTLNVFFRVKHEGGSYMVYATTGSLRCFECGDVGHARHVCPHKERGNVGCGFFYTHGMRLQGLLRR